MKDPLQPKHCARLLQAIADPERLRIISSLVKGPRTVTEIARLLDTSLGNVSHHLSVLRRAGLAQGKKQGRFVLYQSQPAFYHPSDVPGHQENLDLGCCRLAFPKGD